MISEVYNCDCLDYMKEIEDNFFDLAIVDPPYGLKKSSVAGKGKLTNRILNTADMNWDTPPTKEYFNELFRVSKNQIIWGGNYFELPPTRGIISWDKDQYFPNFSAFEYAWTSFYMPAKIFKHNSSRGTSSRGKIHPTQKPIELYLWLLKKYAKQGDKIFDSHMGSQSSRIAAYQFGFDYWGCELSEDYFQSGNERFEKECKGIFKTSNGTVIQTKLEI